MVGGATAKNQQYLYLVKKTGNIMLHNNPEYVRTMRDFNSVPVVQHALQGETRVTEYYNPVENQSKTGSLCSRRTDGLGRDRGITRGCGVPARMECHMAAAEIIALFSLIAIGSGWYIGNGITAPITSMSQVTRIAFKTDDYRKLLPLGRDDEIGDLAPVVRQDGGYHQKGWP